MIRFSKNFFMNPAKIWISGIKCSYDNMIKIADVFDCKWISLTIDSVTEESSLLKLIKDQKFEYSVRQHSTNYMEISVMMPYDSFKYVLKKAISEDPENIFMFNLLELTNWNEQLQHPFEELVATGITNAFISVSLDENALLISVNKFLLSLRDVYKKIKELRLS